MAKANVLRYLWNFKTNRRELVDDKGNFIQPQPEQTQPEQQQEQQQHINPVPVEIYDDDYVKCVRDNICPNCKSHGLEHSGGCVNCRHCGWSACG